MSGPIHDRYCPKKYNSIKYKCNCTPTFTQAEVEKLIDDALSKVSEVIENEKKAIWKNSNNYNIKYYKGLLVGLNIGLEAMKNSKLKASEVM